MSRNDRARQDRWLGAKRINRESMPCINDLAPEIVIRILEGVVDPSEWTIDHLRTQALVSRYFLSVVASAPGLWTVARFGGPTSSRLEVVELALRKSKEAPLIVILEHNTEITEADTATFLITVVHHSRRWKAASFHTHHTRLIKHHLANLNVPMLESFAYDQEISVQYEPRFSILGGTNMRHLILARVGAVGNTAQLCGLRTLCLRGLHPQYEITTAEIVAMISHFPLLEKLSINGVDTVEGHSLGPTTLQPIVLPHLHTLDLSFVASALLIALMTRIKAERLTCLRVITASAESSLMLLRLLAEKENTMGRFLLSPHFRSGFDEILISEAEDLIVVVGPHASKRAGSLSLSLSDVPLSTACDCLSATLPRLPLDLYVAQDTIYPLQVLDRTHSITSITIKNGSGRNILAYLAQPPDIDSGGFCRWRCPKLELLSISEGAYDGSASLLASFLVQRYKHLDFSERNGKDAQHFVLLSGPVLPAPSVILPLTRPELPGIHVEVAPRKGRTYIIMTKIPRSPRPTSSQRWMVFAIPAYLSLVAFAAVLFFHRQYMRRSA